MSQAYWRVLRWDEGTTEKGSSGCPLFDHSGLLIGNLIGGVATCSSPVNDYFMQFSKAWNYRSEQNRQLRHWLDPLNTNAPTLEGLDGTADAGGCIAYTNFGDDDLHELQSFNTNGGYWSGTNTGGYLEFAEAFRFANNGELRGVSLGVAKNYSQNGLFQSNLMLKIYEGEFAPEQLIYAQEVPLRYLRAGAMNQIGLEQPVYVQGPFYVAFSLEGMRAADTFAVYQSFRENNLENMLYLKSSAGWSSFIELRNQPSSILVELMACQLERANPIEWPEELVCFPNPVGQSGSLMLHVKDGIGDGYSVRIFDLQGRQYPVSSFRQSGSQIRINLQGKRAGVYIVQLHDRQRVYHQKVVYMPW